MSAIIDQDPSRIHGCGSANHRPIGTPSAAVGDGPHPTHWPVGLWVGVASDRQRHIEIVPDTSHYSNSHLFCPIACHRDHKHPHRASRCRCDSCFPVSPGCAFVYPHTTFPSFSFFIVASISALVRSYTVRRTLTTSCCISPARFLAHPLR